jgi:hypothetical protein
MTDHFTVSLDSAKIGDTAITDTALSDGTIKISSGTSFSYALRMTPLDGKTGSFQDGDVLNYHVGNVTGLNFPAESTSETLSIESTNVGSAVFLYDSTTGSIDLRVTFNAAAASYTVGEMTFSQSAQFSLNNTQTVTVNLASVTTSAHTVTATGGSSAEDTDPYVPTYTAGTVASANKTSPWGVLPKNSYAYTADNGTTYPYIIWNIWFGDAVKNYEDAKAGKTTYTMSDNLILTETLDANQRFCTGDISSISSMVSRNGSTPFGIQLPVHYVGTQTDGTSQMPQFFCLVSKGRREQVRECGLRLRGQ